MSKSTYPLQLPLSVKRAAQRLAQEDGVSLNQWIAAAVAEKVGAVESAAEFFRRRAGKATGKGLVSFLRKAPRVAPEPEDRLKQARRSYAELPKYLRGGNMPRRTSSLPQRFRTSSLHLDQGSSLNPRKCRALSYGASPR